MRYQKPYCASVSTKHLNLTSNPGWSVLQGCSLLTTCSHVLRGRHVVLPHLAHTETCSSHWHRLRILACTDSLVIMYKSTHFVAVMQSTHAQAVGEFFQAYRLGSQQPLTLLCIALAYIQHAMTRKVEDRNRTVLQAFAFLQVSCTGTTVLPFILWAS